MLGWRPIGSAPLLAGSGTVPVRAYSVAHAHVAHVAALGITANDAAHVHTVGSAGLGIEASDAWHGQWIMFGVPANDTYHGHVVDTAALGIAASSAWHVHAAGSAALGIDASDTYHGHVVDTAALGIAASSAWHVHAAGSAALGIDASDTYHMQAITFGVVAHDAFHVHVPTIAPLGIDAVDTFHRHFAGAAPLGVAASDTHHLHVPTIAPLGVQASDTYHAHAVESADMGIDASATYHSHAAQYAPLGIQASSTYHLHRCTQAVIPFDANELRREYAVFLRFAHESVDYAFGSVPCRRDGLWHDDRVVAFPEPQDLTRDRFGIQPRDRFDVGLEDADGEYADLNGALIGTAVLFETVTTHVLDDGQRPETVWQRMMVVTGFRRRAGVLTLRLADMEHVRLDGLYPSRTFTVADHAELFSDHVGRPVPVVVGTAEKVPGTLISTGSGSGPWRYAFAERVVGTPTILTVYRDGRIVSSSEYSQVNVTTGGYTVLCVSFGREQIDFSGQHHDISADLSGYLPRNAATELARVLAASGCTVDETSFEDAAAYATDNGMLVDIGYVTPRRLSSIVEDLLFVLRGTLYRKADGSYAIVQEREREPVAWYTEGFGDLIDVDEFGADEIPSSVDLEYRPDDVGRYRHRISRSAGGAVGSVLYSAPYVRDHETADRLLCYLALRAARPQEASANVYGGTQHIPLDVVSIGGTLVWTGDQSFLVRGVRRRADNNALDLLLYDPDVYVYTPGTLPADASTGYSPDYSQTPPDAPTSVAVVSQASVMDADGKVTARVTVRAAPPSVNWTGIWFAATNSSTNEVYLGFGEDIGGGYYGTTLPGLRPNIGHTLRAWAVNANGIEGASSAGVAFTSATDTTVPATPSGLSVTQGSGRVVLCKCGAVSDADLSHYEWQRNGSTVEPNGGTSFADTTVFYNTSYNYRVRAVDRSGNASAWSGTVSISPLVNIGGGEIYNGGVGQNQLASGAVGSVHLQSLSVDTAKIQSLAVEEAKIGNLAVSYTKRQNVFFFNQGSAGGAQHVPIYMSHAHFLGKIPTFCVACTDPLVNLQIKQVDNNWFEIVAVPLVNVGAFTVNIYYW